MIYDVWFTTDSAIPVPTQKKTYSYLSDQAYEFGQFVMVDTSRGPQLCIIAGTKPPEELQIPKGRLKHILGRVLIEPYLEGKISRAKIRPPVWWDERTGGRGLTWWKDNS